MMKRALALIAMAVAAGGLAGCKEQAQQTAYQQGKGYAGKEDTPAYASDKFKGDKTKWEVALADRNKSQHEYIRMGNDKK